MRVSCVENRGAKIPPECLWPEAGITIEKNFLLVVGKEYVVYALTFFKGMLWYYIADESFTSYPIWHPSPLFKVVDDRMSIYWRLGFQNIPGEPVSSPIIAFPEWAHEPFYYDKLTDGDPEAAVIFLRYKQKMDEE